MESTPNAQPTKTAYVNRSKVKVNRSNALAKTSCQFPDQCRLASHRLHKLGSRFQARASLLPTDRY